jgi:ribonuclease-3
VLGLAVAHHAYRRFPAAAEGELARLRAQAVSRLSCAVVAADLGLDADLHARAAELGAGAGDLAGSENVLGAALEAAIGACHLEHGLARTLPAVADAFAPRVTWALLEHVDYKTVLQEDLARRDRSVTYELVETSGPAHRRTFTSVATVAGREIGRGSGSSKKESEQLAARRALEAIRDEAGEGGSGGGRGGCI